MSSHRQTIIRKTRIYQALVVALFGCAAAGVALPMGSFLSPAPTAGATKPVAAGPTTNALAPIDTAESGKILASFLKWNPGDKHDEEVTKTDTKPVVVAVSHDWQYSGSMISATSRAAIVKIDSQQHRLREGEKFGDTTLVAVEPDSITIRTGSDEKKVPLQARTQTWPTEGPKRAAAPGKGPGLPGQPGPPGAMPSANPVPQTFDGRNTPGGVKPKPGTVVPPGAQPRSSSDQLRPPDKLDANHRDSIVQQLRQVDLPVTSKVNALRQLGIMAGMDPTLVNTRLREFGLDPTTDSTLNEAVKMTVGGSP